MTFWPETDAEFDLIERVANAALAEAGRVGFRLFVEADGTARFDDPQPPTGWQPDIERALTLAWTATTQRQARLTDGYGSVTG